jgi:hypothetical protein
MSREAHAAGRNFTETFFELEESFDAKPSHSTSAQCRRRLHRRGNLQLNSYIDEVLGKSIRCSYEPVSRSTRAPARVRHEQRPGRYAAPAVLSEEMRKALASDPD